jgi:hypothetical protein
MLYLLLKLVLKHFDLVLALDVSLLEIKLKVAPVLTTCTDDKLFGDVNEVTA